MENGKRADRRLRIIEFLVIGLGLGIIEDLIAVTLVAKEPIDLKAIWVVFFVALPFAFVSEVVVDHPRFWENILPASIHRKVQKHSD